MVPVLAGDWVPGGREREIDVPVMSQTFCWKAPMAVVGALISGVVCVVCSMSAIEREKMQGRKRRDEGGCVERMRGCTADERWLK